VKDTIIIRANGTHAEFIAPRARHGVVWNKVCDEVAEFVAHHPTPKKIILRDCMPQVNDIFALFAALHTAVPEDTLLQIEDVKPIFQTFGRAKNWVPQATIRVQLTLAGFELVPHREFTLVRPLTWLYRWLNPHYSIRARAQKLFEVKPYACSIIVPCHNEQDNIEHIFKEFLGAREQIGERTELIIVDDGSKDETTARSQALTKKYAHTRVISYTPNRGKSHAVQTGFDAARGEVLMIWDADRTVPANMLPRFYFPIARGLADFTNGTRLIYPMQSVAMPTRNRIGNKIMSLIFTVALRTHITDTLCGTKALLKRDYLKISMGHEPWGDFDLLIGARELGLRIVEVPVRYGARELGESKMKFFKHGIALFKGATRGIWQLRLKPILPLLIIVGGALALRLWGIWPNFPYHPDESKVIDPALTSAAGLFGHFDPNPHRFIYGSLYPQLLGLILTIVAGATFLIERAQALPVGDWQTYLATFNDGGGAPLALKHTMITVIAARSVVAVLGASTVLLVYHLTRRAFNNHLSALFAAAALAVAPLAVRDGQFATIDVVLMCAITLGTYCAVRAIQEGRPRFLYWSLFIGGIAASIKFSPLYGIAAVIAPFALLGTPSAKRFWNVKTIITGVVLFVTGYLIGNPYIITSWNEVYTDIKVNFPAYSIFNDKTGQFGFFSKPGGPFANWFVLNYTIFIGYTLLFSLAAALGFFVGLWKNARVTLVLALPTVLFALFALIVGARYERLMLPTYPFLAVLTGLGFGSFFMLKKRGIQTITALSGALIVAVAFYSPLRTSWATSAACSKSSTYSAMHALIDATIPPDATVFATEDIRFPPTIPDIQKLNLGEVFSLEEARARGADYIVISKNALDYRYPERMPFYEENVPSQYNQNSFLELSLAEYRTRAPGQRLVKGGICLDDSQELFRVTPTKINSSQVIFSQTDGQSFRNLTYTQGLSNGKYSLAFIPITPALDFQPRRTYAISFEARLVQIGANPIPDGFGRLDINGFKVLTARMLPTDEWQTLSATFTLDNRSARVPLMFQSQVFANKFEIRNIRILENNE